MKKNSTESASINEPSLAMLEADLSKKLDEIPEEGRIRPSNRVASELYAKFLKFAEGHKKTSGVRRVARYSSVYNTNIDFEVAPGVFLAAIPGSVLDDHNDSVDTTLIDTVAKMTHKIIGTVLNHKGATIVTDPICYTHGVGVFVKNGSAVDAARKAAILRDIDELSTENMRFFGL